MSDPFWAFVAGVCVGLGSAALVVLLVVRRARARDVYEFPSEAGLY